MPLGPFSDFQDCVDHMTAKGHSDDSARKICGAIKAKVEGEMTEEEAIKLAEEELYRAIHSFDWS